MKALNRLLDWLFPKDECRSLGVGLNYDPHSRKLCFAICLWAWEWHKWFSVAPLEKEVGT